MDLTYIDKVGLSEEAEAVVRRVYSEMSGKSDFAALCEHIDAGRSFIELRQMIDECAEKHGQNIYEMRLTVLLASLETARQSYIKNGIEEMFFAGLGDFAAKQEECLKVCGVYGSRSVEWFLSFFLGQRYTFGRLQYQPGSFTGGESYERAGTVVHKGDAVWNIHIPSGGPLTPESVDESLRAAQKGLPKTREDGKTVFVCHTWLFYPPYQGSVFPVGSNTYNFGRFFDIILSVDADVFKDCWRVFSVDSYEDVNELPTETSMQKRFVEYIKGGGKFGNALGIIIADDNGRL